MNLTRRWLDPGPAQHGPDLIRSVTAARVMVVLTVPAAIVIAVALHLRGRQLEAAVVGLAGVTTALVADAILRWIAWQVQRSMQAAEPATVPIDHGRATTRADGERSMSGAA